MGGMLPPKVILTTTDFSDASQPGLLAAARLAQSARAELHVLYVEETMLAEAAKHSGIDIAGTTSDELTTFVGSVLPKGAPAPRLHVSSGDPAAAILDSAAKLGADLIVMASHGRTGVGRAVFGSVAEGVLRRTPVPVLVIPDEYRESAG